MPDGPALLIVEEDNYIQQMFSTSLKRRGLENLHYVSGGEGALAITAHLKPALVICEVAMSDVDGLSYLAMIRGSDRPEISKTPVVLIADEAGPESVMKAKSLKANGYLTKPVSMAVLDRHVNSALQGV